VRLIESMSWPKMAREVKYRAPKRMFDHSQQAMEERGDFQITLHLAEPTSSRSKGLPVVEGGVVPVRLDVAEKDRARALARRFEAVFFLDGQFVFENEVGYLPMTLNWDLKGVNEGVHTFTANLRGYEGNFGVATIQVHVSAPPPTHEASR
jgi:hypothetical protein